MMENLNQNILILAEYVNIYFNIFIYETTILVFDTLTKIIFFERCKFKNMVSLDLFF